MRRPAVFPASALAALVVALAVPGTAAAKAPWPWQLGVAASGGLHELPADELALELDAARDSGARWVRFDLNWDVVQAEGPDSWNWEPFDRIVLAARERGLSLLATIWYTPEWARPPGTPVHHRPSVPRDYGEFAGAAAERYKELGVHRWEIWNEPNLRYAWAGGVSARKYGQILRAAAVRIRRADERAVIITGGLSPAATGGGSRSPANFLRRLYKAGYKRWFDHVGHHASMFPYSPTIRRKWSPWRQMAWTKPSLRSVMVRNGDRRKRIWLTEYGAPTGGDRAVSPARQERLLRVGYRLWAGYKWAGPLFWYATRDRGEVTWHTTCGLVGNDFTPKPAFDAYREIVTAAERR